MSTLSQFMTSSSSGAGGGAVPLGAYADFPSNLGNTITIDTQVFLKSGITPLASAYPTVPSSVTGPITNTLEYAITSGVAYGQSGGNMMSVANAAGTVGLSFFMSYNGSQERKTYYRTTNAIDVTPYKMPYSDSGLVGAVWFNSKFLLYFVDGAIYSSTDGISWTSEISPQVSNYIRKVKVVNGMVFGFAYVPSNTQTTYYNPGYQSAPGSQYTLGYIWYSTNGTTFTTITMPSADTWMDIAYNGNIYNVISVGKVARSTTLGGTWSTVNAPTSPYPVSFAAIESVNSKFVYSASHAYPAYWWYRGIGYCTSNDGATTPTYTTFGDIINGTYNADDAPALYVFGSTLYVYSLYGVKTTTDGTTFSNGTAQTITDTPGAAPTYPIQNGRQNNGKEWAYVNSKWYHVSLYSSMLRTAYTSSTPFSAASYTAGTTQVAWNTTVNQYSSRMDNETGTMLYAAKDYQTTYSATTLRTNYFISTNNGLTWSLGQYPSAGQWGLGTWDGTYFYIFKRTSTTVWEFYRSTTGATGTWSLSATLTMNNYGTDTPTLFYINGSMYFLLGLSTFYIYKYQDGTATLSYVTASYGSYPVNVAVNNAKTLACLIPYAGGSSSVYNTYIFDGTTFQGIIPAGAGTYTGMYTNTAVWDKDDNLWTTTYSSTYWFKNGVPVASATKPASLVYGIASYDKSTNRVWLVQGTKLAYSTDFINWTIFDTNKTIPFINPSSFCVKNNVVYSLENTDGFNRSTVGTYIQNQTAITANNTTKYMRVA